jgi:5'-methylthioadenosine phosphorylase
MATMARTIGTARGIITRLPALLGERSPCPHRCDRALDAAVLTPPDARDPAVVRRLDAVAGRVLQARSER